MRAKRIYLLPTCDSDKLPNFLKNKVCGIRDESHVLTCGGGIRESNLRKLVRLAWPIPPSTYRIRFGVIKWNPNLRGGRPAPLILTPPFLNAGYLISG